jgi:glyoxylase-like metal-dependent hydrolase (beta-lactamase superfamily II)
LNDRPAAAVPDFEVLAIRYATRATTKSECFYRYPSYGEPDAPMRMDYFFWLLRDGDRTVLVDTGFHPAAAERRGRTCLIPPVEALARIGVAPESVSQIILTHLHYDHTGNVAAFPDAELVVPQRELDFWSSPAAAHFQFAAIVEPDEVARVVQADRDGRVRRLQGSALVSPGISAICVGGHSPGQLVLVLDGRGGPVILASDAVHFYEELERDRPFEIFVDLEGMYRGYDTLRQLSEQPGAVLVAGHDPAVSERFPGLTGDGEGLGVRIA